MSNDWMIKVSNASAGVDLFKYLAYRLTNPYKNGPSIDDFNSEAAEDVFINLANADKDFCERLEQTIAGYFEADGQVPEFSESETLWLNRSLLLVVGVLSLSKTVPALLAWLERHEAALRAQPDAILGRAVLDALATAQRGTTYVSTEFWLNYWNNGPVAWQPRSFIGLRLNNAEEATRQIPLLIERVCQYPTSDAIPAGGALLLGFWKQKPNGRETILNWLNAETDPPTVKYVRLALRAVVPQGDLALL